MTLNEYQTLTGITVPTSKQAIVIAQLAKTQRILEGMLGFTLDTSKYDDNQYTETGKTSVECPCPDDNNTLLDPDEVVFAYRLYPYHKNDQFLLIDPASEIHAVKLVKDGVTYRTFDADEYRGDLKQGIIKFLEVCATSCCCSPDLCQAVCKCVQLAVDATWLWSEGNIPDELLDIQAEMTTYYSTGKTNIKSETLGSHSYTKFSDTPPQFDTNNMSIITKYAGPLGSVKRTVTI